MKLHAVCLQKKMRRKKLSFRTISVTDVIILLYSFLSRTVLNFNSNRFAKIISRLPYYTSSDDMIATVGDAVGRFKRVLFLISPHLSRAVRA